MTPVLVDGIDRLFRLVLMLWEERHQPVGCKILVDVELGEADNAYTRACKGQQHVALIGGDMAFDLDSILLPILCQRCPGIPWGAHGEVQAFVS